MEIGRWLKKKKQQQLIEILGWKLSPVAFYH